MRKQPTTVKATIAINFNRIGISNGNMSSAPVYKTNM